MFPASSRTRQLAFLLYASCFLLSLPLDPPQHVAAAASPPISFTFDFSNKSSYNPDDLRPEGDAIVGTNLVDLTCNSLALKTISNCTGRVSYNYSVPFYNEATGEVASFATEFTFRIMLLDNETAKGDGMAFFLTSYPSALPPDSIGRGLGLASRDGGTGYGKNRFVAVEFDTYKNYFDLEPSDHMGIDLSTVLYSVNVTTLPIFNTTSKGGSFPMGGNMTASINFTSSTGMLVARLHFDDHPSTPPVEVSWKMTDLLTLLPSEVAVGFSGATGANKELHQILAWSFNSTLARPKKPVSIGMCLWLYLFSEKEKCHSLCVD
jgi:hypothetical protein